MFLGDTRSALNPSAAFVNPNGSVFFAPEHLSNRCLYLEGMELDRYNCPDLIGMSITAFCAGIMLYQIFTGSHPYPSREIFQDMREGIFLPVRLAAPEIDSKLAGLIQSALMLPVEKKPQGKSGIEIVTELLEILMNKENAVIEVSREKSEQVEKEKKLYLFKQNTFIKTRRFVLNNKYLLMGIAVGIFFALFVTITTAQGIARRPTTGGLSAEKVVVKYYEAFSNLDHQFMQACIQGATKVDVNAATSLYAIVKTRQSYEITQTPSIVPAETWRENGGELPSENAFGVTDLDIQHISGSRENRLIIYRAQYMLWSPVERFPRNRTDILSLRPDRHGNWRIIEIIRTER